MKLELNERTVIDIEIDNVNSRDYPDFCDAYICYAVYEDGNKLTEKELDQLTDENQGSINEYIFDHQLYL